MADGLKLATGWPPLPVRVTLVQAPRPCVQPTRLAPSFEIVTASTLAFGRPEPTIDHTVEFASAVPPQLPQIKTPPVPPWKPLSVPTTIVFASVGSAVTQSGMPPGNEPGLPEASGIQCID